MARPIFRLWTLNRYQVGDIEITYLISVYGTRLQPWIIQTRDRRRRVASEHVTARPPHTSAETGSGITPLGG